ncbi:MAG: hypothetical protein WC315_00305 [Candidatus Omnitrophota bacterium]|jgi:hypothetical protein
MTKTEKRFIKASLHVIKLLLIAIAIEVALPFAGGIWYSNCGERYVEQVWLDRAIFHLKILRRRCTDPELISVLDYTINRYHHVGGFDVMVAPCFSPGRDYKIIGLNQPYCPGVTIDPEVMFYPIHEGALVLVHEALHDYFPYWGHSHVTPIMKRIEAL